MKILQLARTLGVLALAGIIASSLSFGQGLTSSGMSGFVTDAGGTPVSGATVTVTHVPTGQEFETRTRSNGSFGISGLSVGGPYSVRVDSGSHQQGKAEGVYLSLSRTEQVDIRLPGMGATVELDEFVVTEDDFSPVFNRNNMGAGSTIDDAALESIPAQRRSLNDVARFNPYTTINDGERNEMTVAGQNFRFNSIKIDGIRTNDQFGLNSSGQASLNNPISLDALEQISVEVSPYDVRQSGFTGASINAVTKSGSNEFKGTFFTYYNNDTFRGEDVRNGDNTDYEEWTWGFNLSGPIVEDSLFFFFNYEKFQRSQQAGNQGFEPEPTAIQQVIDYSRDVLGIDVGTFGGSDQLKEEDDKLLGKIDWHLNDKHRLSARYRKTEGTRPILADFDDNGQTSLTSNFYDIDVKEVDYSFELFSRWTPDFQTEIRATKLEYDSVRTTGSNLPHMVIDDFPTVGETGDTGNELFFGTERFSHANELGWSTFQLSGVGTYYMDNVTLTFGADYEKTEYSNLFLESSKGNYGFDNLDDFLNDVAGGNEFGQSPFRGTAIDGQNPVAEPDVAVLGYFAQAKWDASSRLTLIGGIRADTTFQDAVPPVSQGFEDAFGFKNNGTVDGQTLVAPRISFNYAVTEDRSVQLRGGIGSFMGRAPGVWLANVFTNNGETSGLINLDTGLRDYLANDFDPENPIISIPREDSTPVVDALEDGLSLPSVWRANLAIDYQLPWHDLIFTVEGLFTQVENALWVENANQQEVGVAFDGRTQYDGRVSDDFSDVYVLRNTGEGDAMNFSLKLTKPDRNRGFFGTLSYTWGTSDEVNPFTSSRAVSNWRNRSVLDPNVAEVGTSNYEVSHRLLTVLGYTHNWGESGHSTKVSVVGEVRTGRPYSAVFRSDVNGDGRSDNDLLYIPTGPSDPNVNFDPGFDQTGFFNLINELGLDSYAGQAVPRNSQKNPWVGVWDLKIVHRIPDMGRFGAELFFDFRNISNWLNEDWGLVEEIGFPYNRRLVVGSYDSANDVYNFDQFNPDNLSTQVGNVRSRWSIQWGLKLHF